MLFGRRLLVRSDHDIAILDPSTGEVICQASNNELLTVDDSLFIVRSGDEIVRLDTDSGAQLWRRNLGQASSELADRSPRSRNDDDVFHECLLIEMNGD